MRDGEVGWSHAWGMANIGAARPVRTDTLFMLASVSKTVVTTAVFQAIEDGLFELDTHVNDVLPFRVRNPVHPEQPITVRQLLTHTSSIRDNWTLLNASYVAGDAEMELRTSSVATSRRAAPTSAEQLLLVRPRSFLSVRERRRRRRSLPRRGRGRRRLRHVVRTAFAPLGMDRAGWHLADPSP